MRDSSLRPWILAVALLTFGWGLRLLFVFATPDAVWPYSFGFKGDSIEFLRQASWLLGKSPPFELGLPLRPPGNGHLVAWFWDGEVESLGLLRHLWIGMGAALAPALYLSSRGSLGDRVAGIAGGFTAAASGPLLLSASLCNETPYLLGATLSVGVLASLRAATRGRLFWVAVWSLGQAILCLVRAEHLLFFLAGLAWVAAGTTRPRLPIVLAGAAAFAVGIVPWQVAAHAAIERLNTGAEQVVYRLDWAPDAVEAVAGMPRFARQSTVAFVEGTVQVRGRNRVDPADLGILDEAYDYRPEPLDTWPFVALHGGLNFYLANHPASAEGFSREPLFAAPRLDGGPGRYPPGLQLPRDLALSYPPHLRILNRGFGLGIDTILADVPGWLGRVGAKYQRMWAGAAHGFGGYAVPVGMSGLRRRVDMVTPEGGWAMAWRIAVLVLALAGAWQAFQFAAVRPWLLWIGIRLLVVAGFFGYARQGVLLVPAIGVLLGLLCDRYWRPWIPRVGLALLAGLLAAECYRFARPPEITVDGAVLVPNQPDPTATTADDRTIHIR